MKRDRKWGLTLPASRSGPPWCSQPVSELSLTRSPASTSERPSGGVGAPSGGGCCTSSSSTTTTTARTLRSASGNEHSQPVDLVCAAHLHLSQRADGLRPPEHFLDPLAQSLADGVARVSRRAAVDRTRFLLSDMRGEPQFAQLVHEVLAHTLAPLPRPGLSVHSRHRGRTASPHLPAKGSARRHRSHVRWFQRSGETRYAAQELARATARANLGSSRRGQYARTPARQACPVRRLPTTEPMGKRSWLGSLHPKRHDPKRHDY